MQRDVRGIGKGRRKGRDEDLILLIFLLSKNNCGAGQLNRYPE